MTTIDTTTLRHPAFGAVAGTFRALGAFLRLLAEAGPRVEALNRLTRTSDEELAARGTTRNAEIRRLVGVDAAD